VIFLVKVKGEFNGFGGFNIKINISFLLNDSGISISKKNREYPYILLLELYSKLDLIFVGI